jgi:4-amino-4-deoxy-L-arabinose transferase-like glycosyltransferase
MLPEHLLQNEIGESRPRRQKLRGCAAGPSELAILAAALGLACFLFLFRLGARSFWRDEGFSVLLARMNAPDFLHLLRTRELNSSPYFLLLRAWLHLGTDEATIRLLSVIPAVATVVTIYYLGKRLFTPWAGAVSALLLAVNTSLLTYAQQARGYTLAVFLVTLSSLLFVRQVLGGSRRNWAAYILVSALGAYAHFFVLLVLAAQWISLLFFRPRPRRAYLLAGAAGLVLLLLPLFSFLATKHPNVLYWISPLTPTKLLKTFLFLGGGPTSFAYAILWLLSFFLVLRSSTLLNGGRFVFLQLWLFLPLGITVAVSLVKPVLEERFLIICLPAGALLATAAMSQLRPRFASMMAALLVIGSVYPLVRYYRQPTEDWRSAAAYIAAHALPSDAIAAEPQFADAVLQYYLLRNPQPSASRLRFLPFPLSGPFHENRIWLTGCCTSEDRAITLHVFERAAGAKQYRIAESHAFSGITIWRMQHAGLPVSTE